MTDLLSRFRCPACAGALVADTASCLTCGQRYGTQDGILDFVGGRFATQLDAAQYDDYHAIDDNHSEMEYHRVKRLAAGRWPASLGSVVEIGCGTGNFSRAMIGHRAATDAVLTDVSTDMLRICRRHLDRLGISSSLPLHFATYSAHEACFGDAAFDTCVGASVVHHMADVPAFLADVWRFLKPGGRAFFIEPSLRYHRVLAMAFADIIAFTLTRDPAFSPERQTLLNWVAEARKGTMLQGDLAMLADMEDKHMFVGEAFETMALEAGFATAEAIPSTPDPTGLDGVGGLLARLGLGQMAKDVMRLWPSYANRYLPLLNSRDLSLGYLFWLTKSDSPRARTPAAIAKPPRLRPSTEEAVTGGGMPLRVALTMTPQASPAGLKVKVEGWFLANADIKSVRVRIDGVDRQAPVWLPRADVHIALNRDGGYAAWNSLCCGVDAELLFDGVRPKSPELPFNADLVFSDGRFVPMIARGMLRLGSAFHAGR